MELGYTIPLMKLLKKKRFPYSEAEDLRFSWDLHCITLYGRQSLLAVHCTTRYTFVIYDLNFSQWDNLADTFIDGLQASLLDLGISQQQIDRYFTEAGQVQYTKTHGRREVAFLNRAWNDVMDSDSAINPDEQYQPLLDSMVNTTTSRCAGYSGPGLAGLRMKAELMAD